jgi:hypothetical protein
LVTPSVSVYLVTPSVSVYLVTPSVSVYLVTPSVSVYLVTPSVSVYLVTPSVSAGNCVNGRLADFSGYRLVCRRVQDIFRIPPLAVRLA